MHRGHQRRIESVFSSRSLLNGLESTVARELALQRADEPVVLHFYVGVSGAGLAPSRGIGASRTAAAQRFLPDRSGPRDAGGIEHASTGTLPPPAARQLGASHV